MSAGRRVEGAKRDWGTDESGCAILHVDMDAFFASIEVARNPHLRGLPVVVAGAERSVVLAATYEARKFGIHSAMPTTRARNLAPTAVFLEPDIEYYRWVSSQVMEIFANVTPLVEQVSVDEAFLDVSGVRRLSGGPLVIAQGIREQVVRLFGITCSVGVARNKFVAKLASTHSKPDGLMLIPDAATVEFLHALPVGALWGVGAKTNETLAKWGIESVAQLAHTQVPHLANMVGLAAASHLHNLAWGIDARKVETHTPEKSIGADFTFGADTDDLSVLDRKILELAGRCGVRLRADGLGAKTVSVRVRLADFTAKTRARTLVSVTQSTAEITEVARQLLREVDLGGQEVRLVGVRTENLAQMEGAPIQMTLEDSLSEASVQRGASEHVMDEVRRRFGSESITLGSQTRGLTSNTRVDPLSLGNRTSPTSQ